MQPRHHLDASSIIAYAAGTLSLPLGVVAATHLESCAHCRHRVADAERVGGLLVEQQQAAEIADERRQALRAAMSAALDDPPAPPPEEARLQERRASLADSDRLPAPLRAHFGERYSALPWRWVAPGVHCIRAPGHSGLILLKIAAGKSLPVHSHGGNELTQVLRGAYDDLLGHFAPGDIADLDGDVEHQPVTSPGVACICVSALDAPLRFPGWFARLLQPLVKL